VEITPCPGCGARLSPAAADLGLDVQCPYCKRVYKAVRAGNQPPLPPPPPPKQTELEDLGGSGRGRRPREEEEDDRPSRRRRGRDDSDDDDDYDRRPRRRRRARSGGGGNKSAARIISAIFSLLLGAQYLGCGVLVIVASSFILGLIGAVPEPQHNPQAAQTVKTVAGVATGVLICCGLGTILYSLLYFLAGIGALTRKGYGKVLLVICGVLSALSGLAMLYSTGRTAVGEDFGHAAFNGVQFLLFVGHAVASFLAVFGPGKDEFD
jgi:hypothetical protein